MRFQVAKFTALGRNPGDVVVLALIYDRESEMGMVAMLVFQGGNLVVADVPGCRFGEREEYKEGVDEIEAEVKRMGAPRRDDGSFDDGREAENFLFDGLDLFKVKPFDKGPILAKLDQAAADCFQPAKNYGWLTPARGWTRDPAFL
jgi:hypothetical protein